MTDLAPPAPAGALSGPRNFFMAKAMSIFGMVVSALMLLAFGADMALSVPFGGANFMMDAGFAAASAILAYMSFDAFRASN